MGEEYPHSPIYKIGASILASPSDSCVRRWGVSSQFRMSKIRVFSKLSSGLQDLCMLKKKSNLWS